MKILNETVENVRKIKRTQITNENNPVDATCDCLQYVYSNEFQSEIESINENGKAMSQN